ncbi:MULTISPECIES: hypothetical protein [unclassified Nocardia]
METAAEDMGLGLPMALASLIGVERLFDDDVLVEVEAIVLLD